MAEELDGVAVATYVLLGNVMTTLLKKNVLSPEDIREALDTSISKIEFSAFDIEPFREARKVLDGTLAQAFRGAPRAGYPTDPAWVFAYDAVTVPLEPPQQ